MAHYWWERLFRDAALCGPRRVVAVLVFLSAATATAQSDLTGVWTADDGALYYLRQTGTRLWWAGFSTETPGGTRDFHKGLQFSNVFQGSITNNKIVGEWVDVPRGRNLNAGTLTLEIEAKDLRRRSETGGFGATVWQRTSSAPSGRDIFTTFDRVKKNQKAWRDHSLLDNLKPAKSKPVAILGRIVPEPIDGQWVHVDGASGIRYTWIPAHLDPDPVHVGYRKHDGRSYQDFICLDHNDSPPDGDIGLEIRVNRADLDAQTLFWDDDWETSHDITTERFRAKLDYDNQNLLHIESIMYGGTTECGDADRPSIQ